MEEQINNSSVSLNRLFLVFLFFLSIAFSAHADHGASLFLSPSTGTFVVGSTFDVSLMINTNNADINAVAVFLSFPPEKLQVVSSSAGKSAIDLWSVPPRFNNSSGAIELQGVVTDGLNASRALLTTITFRVKGTGFAAMRITDGSRVLKHDGKGTDYLQHQEDGIYTLVLPPPAGPAVASQTHPNQEQWYKESNVSLTWSQPSGIKVDEYSYILNATPVDLPDNISEGSDQSVVYQQVGEGTKYFHIKALRNGVWGGTTHFALQIDATEPAEFPLEISPSARTSEKQPVVRFITTDALSGVNHYELKIVPLSAPKEFQFPNQSLFIEVQSPFLLSELEHGRYDILVRAYDNAGNFRESVQRITIREVFFGLASRDGIEVGYLFVIPWSWIVILLVLIVLVLTYEALRLYQAERELVSKNKKDLPPSVENLFKELKKYRDKYGKMSIFLVVIWVGLFLAVGGVNAREQKVEPPLITTISRNISNQDIFYVGGKTNIPQSTVIFYIQNLTTGEAANFEVSSDAYGDWFYTHDAFLSNGDYLLWAQSKVGEITSPPSPQERLSVQPTAVQFGSSRLSYDIIYQIALVVLLILVGMLGSINIKTRRRVERRKERLLKEVREAEEAVRSGFAVLKRDIQQELEIIKKIKMERSLREEEEKREAQLLADLASIQHRIGKEIWDIEALE